MSLSQSPLFALGASRIRTFLREPGAVFWTFGFPLLITVALGVAFRNQGPGRFPVALVEGPGAEGLAVELAHDPAIGVRVSSSAEAAQLLRTGGVLVVVSVGGEVAGRAGEVVYTFDPSRPDAPAARRAIDDHLQRRSGRRDVLLTRDQVTVVQGARYVDWLVPGLLGMQLLSGALWGTAWNIVTARQRKLLKRLAATPMRRGHYLLSFRLAGLVFVPVQTIVLFVFARLTFGVVIHGSWLAVLVLALLASWSFAGLGLLCAARAENTETANGLINLVTMPMFVLSGVFFSSARFPALVQPAIRLLPLSAFNEALRHVVNDGASLFSQAVPIAVLVTWGVTSSVLALRLFRWT
jgi:ABC-type multidrug transport system permease subunit